MTWIIVILIFRFKLLIELIKTPDQFFEYFFLNLLIFCYILNNNAQKFVVEQWNLCS